MIASTFGGVHDFFHSSTWYVMRNLVVFFVIVFWIATVYWVHKDAKRRMEDPLLVWVVTAVGVVPFIGPLIYMLFRPPEYLADVRERELEMQAIQQRLMTRECPVCRAVIEADYLICPVCATKLRHACSNCHKPLEPTWQVCPYCETPVAPAEQPVALRAESLPRRTRKAT